MTSAMNDALIRLTRRAEANDPDSLVQTFVNVGPLLTLLTTRDHQLIFGRRGTGKTHALTYLAESKRGTPDEEAVLIDMRSIGSSGGIYADSNLPVSERGTRLLVDTLSAVHDKLVDLALTAADRGVPGGDALTPLDQLADQIAHVRVAGTVDRETTAEQEHGTENRASFNLSRSPSLSMEDVGTARATRGQIVRESGSVQHSVHFGGAAKLLTSVLESLNLTRLWILLDEWSSLPLDLQPLLADLLRRCLLPLPRVTVKIAAIEQRSRLKEVTRQGDYLGIEVGADMSADLDLDDFMVFGNDEERAKAFFSDLFAKHVEPHLPAALTPMTGKRFIRDVFTQVNAFTELVRAAEGVPRDAINVAILAAQRADNELIAVPHVRTAAKTWYQRDKEPAANANTDAHELLIWIIDEVIGERRAKAFMLQQGPETMHPLVTALYDQRVLHLVRRGVSAKDQPGVRFNVYAIDYGCYVDLITTQRAPKGFLPAEGQDGQAEIYIDIEVPPEDYRSIRRAILSLTDFEGRRLPSA